MVNPRMPEERYAHMYADGSWSTVVDEISMVAETVETGDSVAIRRKAGFEPWVSFGSQDGFSLPMSLEICQRVKGPEPQYVIDVEGTRGHIPHVYARTLPDVMELLSKWAPAVQATAVTELLRQLNNPDDPHRWAPAVQTLRGLLGE